MKARAPYAPGDRIAVLHSCAGRGTELAHMTIDRVVSLNDYRGRWRIETVRCDGSPLQAVVDSRGRDAHGYVERVTA